jgi:hypothetical protein
MRVFTPFRCHKVADELTISLVSEVGGKASYIASRQYYMSEL